jgi:predicted extracellular nuclease
MRKHYPLLMALIAVLCSFNVHAQSNHIVISQVYGGGGNSGATYTNDFIELFNPTTTTVDLTGWSVQYASAAGSTWTATTLSGSIEPGHYYLVQQAKGAGGTVPLPTPDATGSIAMSGTAGKVALVSSTTPLTGSCPTGGTVVDLVGFGSTASCYEGSGAVGTLSNTTAGSRNNEGCADTDDNAANFTVGAPNPRNSASPQHLCFGPELPTISVAAGGDASEPATNGSFVINLSAQAH